MTEPDILLARLDALEARVAILEAERAKRPQMVYNWHLKEPVMPNTAEGEPYWKTLPVSVCYEHYMDPAMRETRNG